MPDKIQRYRDTLFGLADDPEGEYVSIDDVAQLIKDVVEEHGNMGQDYDIGVSTIITAMKDKLGIDNEKR